MLTLKALVLTRRGSSLSGSRDETERRRGEAAAKSDWSEVDKCFPNLLNRWPTPRTFSTIKFLIASDLTRLILLLVGTAN